MAGYVETYRGVVAPADCDHLGHMNVQHYFAVVGDGMFAFQTLLGLGPQDVRGGRRMSFAVVRSESEFKSELLAGDVIYLETTILEMGGKSATFGHRLIKAEDGTVAFETRFTCALLDLEARRARAVPDDVRARAAEFTAPTP